MAIVKTVKYESSVDVFAWKYPSTELSNWTQLIVNESQEAVLYKSGMAHDVFGSGRHTLETENIPLLNNLLKLPFGSRSTFSAEIWFVNLTHSLDIKWGTATPIQLKDPQYNIFIPVRSYGQFGIRIVDSKKFLIKLVGTLSILDKESLQKFFRGVYLAKIKDAISGYLIHKKIGILEINAYISEISRHVKDQMTPILAEYGIEVLNFYINDISVPENDPSVVKLRQALTKRAEMDILGTGPEKKEEPPREMVECAACQTKIEKGKRFCYACGHDMESKAEQHQIKCSKCGGALHPTMKFCPQCGDKYNPCPNCGMDVSEGDVTCQACGYEMPEPCPQCGKPVAMGAKFCTECGMSLVPKCAKCDQEYEGSPNFCPNCGEQLTGGTQ